MVIAAGGLEQLHQLLHGGYGPGRRVQEDELVLVLLLAAHSLRNHGEDRTSNRTSTRTVVLCMCVCCAVQENRPTTTGFGWLYASGSATTKIYTGNIIP